MFHILIKNLKLFLTLCRYILLYLTYLIGGEGVFHDINEDCCTFAEVSRTSSCWICCQSLFVSYICPTLTLIFLTIKVSTVAIVVNVNGCLSYSICHCIG